MATIKLAHPQWGTLSPDQQNKIINVMIEHGLMNADDTVKTDMNPPARVLISVSEIALLTRGIHAVNFAALSSQNKKMICKAVCSVAEAAAAAACVSVPGGPVAVAACIALAHAAGDVCRENC